MIRPISPVDNETVFLLTDEQSAFIAATEMRANTDGNLSFKWNDLVRRGEDKSFPMPVTLQWEGACGQVVSVWPSDCPKLKRIIKVSPNVKHLYELKEKIYDNPYLNEPEVLNLSCFEKLNSLTLTYNITTNSADIQDLVGMTPYFYKTSKENLERLNNVNNLDITIDFIIEVYKKAAN